MNLYEIDAAILSCIDTETGEVTNENFDRISQLVMDKEKKIDNLACWYKTLNAEATAIDFEIKALQARKKEKEGKIDSLKAYLSDILDGQRVETARNKISWRQSDEVNILDEGLIPDAFKKAVTEIKVNKVDIKAAIKAGVSVTGAELIYKNNIQIK